MKQEDAYWIDILSHNLGFETPEQWIDVAKKKNFKKVSATSIVSCPGCGSENFKNRCLLSYIYYSNLVHLYECRRCRLVYASVNLSQGLNNQHFDKAYKDERYFQVEREKIFRQVAGMVAHSSSAGDTVLDIGGGKGHLLNTIRQKRCDLQLKLAEISPVSCRWCEENFGIPAENCSLPDMQIEKKSVNIALMIDVLYYENRVSEFWSKLEEALAEKSTVYIRIPNKLKFIKIISLFFKLSHRRRKCPAVDRVPFFNTEHVLIYDKLYVEKRLQEIGFEKAKFLVTPYLHKGMIGKTLNTFTYPLLRFINIVSNYRVVLTPAVLIEAKK